MVAVEIAGTILTLAVDGLVKVFHDGGASRLRFAVVGVDIGDEDGERLGAVTEFGWCLLAGVRGFEHDPGVAQVHLGSAWVRRAARTGSTR